MIFPIYFPQHSFKRIVLKDLFRNFFIRRPQKQWQISDLIFTQNENIFFLIKIITPDIFKSRDQLPAQID